jgi:hypothetical protein
VAIGCFHGRPDCRFYVHNLVCRKDLSDWHPDVWEKTHLERDDQMGLSEELSTELANADQGDFSKQEIGLFAERPAW